MSLGLAVAALMATPAPAVAPVVASFRSPRTPETFFTGACHAVVARVGAVTDFGARQRLAPARPADCNAQPKRPGI